MESFDSLPRWEAEFRAECPDAPLILLANKTDREGDRQVCFESPPPPTKALRITKCKIRFQSKKDNNGQPAAEYLSWKCPLAHQRISRKPSNWYYMVLHPPPPPYPFFRMLLMRYDSNRAEGTKKHTTSIRHRDNTGLENIEPTLPLISTIYTG